MLDYFWTAVTAGRARSHYGDGRVAEVDYRAGDIQHLSFGPGESMTHDLANIGDTELIFTTVEFLDSANPPLALPAAARAEATCRAAYRRRTSGGTAVPAMTASGLRNRSAAARSAAPRCCACRYAPRSRPRATAAAP